MGMRWVEVPDSRPAEPSLVSLAAEVGSHLPRKIVYVFDSCSVSREGAVNLSRDVTLQHVTYVSAHFSVLVFPQGHSFTGPCRPIHSTRGKHFLASTQNSGPSSGVRTELLESLVRARFIAALRTHRTYGYCCKVTAPLYGSGPGSLRLHPGLLRPSPIV